MKRRVAIVTDATSANYFFPHWVAYYGGLFGRENLVVVTYAGTSKSFLPFAIGKLIELPCKYTNTVRRVVLCAVVRTLLTKYDYVVRCDVDEFIVPDPIVYENFPDYMSRLDVSYVTALGLDVVELSGEPPLRFGYSKLLAQRRFGVKAAAYSKTCVTNIPLNWHLGFHFADHAPVFNHLYLFHMKYSDIQGRISWLQAMANDCDRRLGEHQHFQAAIEQLKTTNIMLRGFPMRTGWEAIRERGYQKRIEASVRPPSEGDPFFRSIDGMEAALTEIPDEFRRAL